MFQSFFICRAEGWKGKRVVFYITEGAFLAYIVLFGYQFSDVGISYSDPVNGYGIGGWLLAFAILVAPVFLALFFMNLPFAQTLEIITLAFATFIIIVPLLYGFWSVETAVLKRKRR